MFSIHDRCLAPCRKLTCLLAAMLLSSSFCMAAVEPEMLLTQAIERCEQFGPREYESGLLFNPEGYRTYFRRSACLQRIAVEFRERQLCQRVRRRFSLFGSGWGYSRDNCEALVDAELVSDESALRAKRDAYLVGPVRLASVELVGNGNGRDYDIIPQFEDGFPHPYSLQFALIDERGIDHVIHEWSSYLRGSNDNVRLYLPRQDLLERLPDLEQGREYPLRVRLTLAIGRGGVGGWLREDTIESVFPLAERVQELVTVVVF